MSECLYLHFEYFLPKSEIYVSASLLKLSQARQGLYAPTLAHF